MAAVPIAEEEEEEEEEEEKKKKKKKKKKNYLQYVRKNIRVGGIMCTGQRIQTGVSELKW
jgi:hypothetical protein